MKRNKELVVAVDYDGCFDKVKPLLKEMGVNPIIISGRDEKDRAKLELKLAGEEYQILFLYPNRYVDDIGSLLKSISKWKAKKLKDLKADIFIDDDIKYLLEAKKVNPELTCLLVF